MPEMDRRTAEMMALYQRCAERKCLPYAGGVLDQPEELMRAFDVLDERLAAFRRRKRQDDDRADELERLREAGFGIHRR